MKAVEFGQELICFIFVVIEDGERVVNISAQI